MTMLLVLNASPLNCFARSGALPLLDRVTTGHRRIVPQAVLDELRAGEGEYPLLADIRNVEWLEVVPVDSLDELRAFVSYTRRLGSGKRDVGEANVLAWAEVHEGVAILDDRVAKKVAQERQVSCHGTLWLVINAFRQELIDQPGAERLVDRLRHDGGARFPTDGTGLFGWARERGLL